MTNPNLLTRREFIVNSSLSLLGIALASCTTPPPPQQPQGALRPPAPVVPLPSPDLTADVISRRRQENKKGIPGLDSKPIMSEQDFKRIDGGLKTSPSKLFQIIGNGLQNLWEGKRDQSLFPESVYDKDLSPLVITYDTDSGSFCSLVAQNGDKNEFIFTIDGNKIYRPPVKPFKMGIALGSQVEMRKEGTTPEEFYLAKEAINLFAMPPITSQTARVLRSIYNYTSTDMNGKAIDQVSYTPSTILTVLSKDIPMDQLHFGGMNTVDFSKSTDSSSPTGKIYYDLGLKYYLPANMMGPRDEGFVIKHGFYALSDTKNSQPLEQAKVGDVVREHIEITVPVTRRDVTIEDFIPAGMEIVDTSLATEDKTLSQTEPEVVGSTLWPDHEEWKDDRAFLYNESLKPGTYTFDYMVRALVPGSYLELPAQISELYAPENFGRTGAGSFSISK